MIDLLFEGRKVEGNRKYRRRERVPKAGSRREETITELINSHTIEPASHNDPDLNYMTYDIVDWIKKANNIVSAFLPSKVVRGNRV